MRPAEKSFCGKCKRRLRKPLVPFLQRGPEEFEEGWLCGECADSKLGRQKPTSFR